MSRAVLLVTDEVTTPSSIINLRAMTMICVAELQERLIGDNYDYVVIVNNISTVKACRALFGTKMFIIAVMGREADFGIARKAGANATFDFSSNVAGYIRKRDDLLASPHSFARA